MPSEKRDCDLPRKAREVASILYGGKSLPHRSCGVAIAETFGRDPHPYAALRMGGITKKGECGAIKAGDLVIAEVLGPADTSGPLPDLLRDSILFFHDVCTERLRLGQGGYPCCGDLTAGFEDFTSQTRKDFCSQLVGVVAEALAETVLRFGGEVKLVSRPELEAK